MIDIYLLQLMHCHFFGVCLIAATANLWGLPTFCCHHLSLWFSLNFFYCIKFILGRYLSKCSSICLHFLLHILNQSIAVNVMHIFQEILNTFSVVNISVGSLNGSLWTVKWSQTYNRKEKPMAWRGGQTQNLLAVRQHTLYSLLYLKGFLSQYSPT